MEKENGKYDRKLFCVFIILLTLCSFLCGFYDCQRMMIHQNQTTSRVKVIPKTNGKSMKAPALISI